MEGSTQSSPNASPSSERVRRRSAASFYQAASLLELPNVYSQLATPFLPAWAEVFCAFDRTGNKEVSTTDVGLIFRELGFMLGDAGVRELVLSADLDGSGSIDFEEFTGMMTRWQRAEALPALLRQRGESRAVRALLEARSGAKSISLAPPGSAGRKRKIEEEERLEMLCFLDEIWANESLSTLSMARLGEFDSLICTELGRVLAFSPRLRLQSLDLSDNAIGDAGMAHIIGALSSNQVHTS